VRSELNAEIKHKQQSAGLIARLKSTAHVPGSQPTPFNGEADTQVAAAPNLAAIRQSVESNGNKAVTTVALPHLNHLLQTCQTGLPSEYGLLSETLAPAAMLLWINGDTRQETHPSPTSKRYALWAPHC